MCEKSFCEGENWYVLWDESRLEFEDKSILNVKSGGYNNGNLMKCGKTSKVSIQTFCIINWNKYFLFTKSNLVCLFVTEEILDSITVDSRQGSLAKPLYSKLSI